MRTEEGSGIPAWAIRALGKTVVLIGLHDEYGDGCHLYAKGWRGRLDAIQADDRGGHAVVECQMSGALLDVPFGLLEPAK